MLVTDSRTARSRSIQPFAAAASIIAYSPDTWYAATGTSLRSATSAQDVQVGPRRLHHHDVGALGEVEVGLAQTLRAFAGSIWYVLRSPLSSESTASRNGP